MSCRSTNATSAVTSCAHFLAPKSQDKEVQSLFHSLKRDGKIFNAQAPSQMEYRTGIEKLILRAKAEKDISLKNQERVIARLRASLRDPVPDGPTWYATMYMGAMATPERLETQRLIIDVADSLGWPWDTKKLEDKFYEWTNPATPFEEKSSPDPAFRYEEAYGSTPELKRAFKRLGYQHYLAQPYPVFVYGTLRAGEGNHSIIAGEGAVNEIAEGKMSGIAIYDSTYGAFPYSKEVEDLSIFAIGDIVWLNDDDSGRYTRYDLDRLESFNPDEPSNSHYQRVLKEVKFLEDAEGNSESVMTWVYVASGRSLIQINEDDRIASGNWFDASRWDNVDRQKDLDAVKPIPKPKEGEE